MSTEALQTKSLPEGHNMLKPLRIEPSNSVSLNVCRSTHRSSFELRLMVKGGMGSQKDVEEMGGGNVLKRFE